MHIVYVYMYMYSVYDYMSYVDRPNRDIFGRNMCFCLQFPNNKL